MSLPFFRFKKREMKHEQPEPPMQQSTVENRQSGTAIAEAPAEQQPPAQPEVPRKMLLDLQHLTPETLEAFFPSERNHTG